MLDWDDLRFFLAIARHRTASAAARELHVTQSTVRRRLTSLQAGMGAQLLRRSDDGYALTMAGQAILANVERLESEALCVARALGGHDARFGGVVRLMCSQLVASHVLAPCLVDLHARDRTLMLELVAPLPGRATGAHEVDLAVQMAPFLQEDLFVRKLATVAFGLYAAAGYVETAGAPATQDGCPGHRLITLLDEREMSAQSAWLSEQAGRAEVFVRSDSYETQHWATVCGGGLAVLPRFRADAEPALVRFATAVPIPPAEIWLGVHPESRDLPRVRAVLDAIAHAVRNRLDRYDPGPGAPACEISLACDTGSARTRQSFETLLC